MSIDVTFKTYSYERRPDEDGALATDACSRVLGHARKCSGSLAWIGIEGSWMAGYEAGRASSRYLWARISHQVVDAFQYSSLRFRFQARLLGSFPRLSLRLNDLRIQVGIVQHRSRRRE